MAGSSTASPSQTYALTVANDITVASNGPAGSSTFANGGQTIGFSVTITNPCYTATIPTLTFNPSTLLQVTDGGTGSVEFVRPSNSVETSTSVRLICGEYAFEVYQDSSDTALTSAWVTITKKANSPDTYNFNVDTTVDGTLLTTQTEVDKTVYVKSYLVDYTDIKTYTSKAIKIVKATCDCSALAWDDASITPSTVAVNVGATITVPPPVANTSARSTNAAFDSCY